jgi:hypothetical protein
MGNKRSTERLERAERIARAVWKKAGVEKPDDWQLAAGILVVLEDMDANRRLRAENERLRKIETECLELHRTGWLDGPEGEGGKPYTPPYSWAFEIPVLQSYCRRLRKALGVGMAGPPKEEEEKDDRGTPIRRIPEQQEL